MSALDDRIREGLDHLARPVDGSDAFGPVARRRRRYRMVRRAQAATLAVAVVAGAAAGVWGLSSAFVPGGNRPAPGIDPMPGPTATPGTSPGEDQPGLRIVDVEGIGSDLAVGHGAVWIADNWGALRKLDPASGREIDARAIGGGDAGVQAVAATDDWVWVGSDGGVFRVHPRTLRVKRTESRYSNVLAASSGQLWNQGGQLQQLDPSTGEILVNARAARDAGDLQSRSTRDTAAGFGSGWLADGTTGEVVRVEPDGRMTRVRIGPPFEPVGENEVRPGAYAQSLAVGRGRVWACCDERGRIVPIDPATNRAAEPRLPMPDSDTDGDVGDVDLVWGGGYLWATSCCPDAISRIDIGSGDEVRVPTPGIWVIRLAFGRGIVWGLGMDEERPSRTSLVTFPADRAEEIAAASAAGSGRDRGLGPGAIALAAGLVLLVTTAFWLPGRRRRRPL